MLKESIQVKKMFFEFSEQISKRPNPYFVLEISLSLVCILWLQYHLFRIEELLQIWKKSQKVVEDIDIILAQMATMEYVLLLLQEMYSRNKIKRVVPRKEKTYSLMKPMLFNT